MKSRGSAPFAACCLFAPAQPSAAVNFTAPTLIMGDVGDLNGPLVNSDEWHHALRYNGAPVEFHA